MGIETVKIVREGYRLGWVIINKSDFDPKKHTLYDEGEKEEDRPKRGRPAKE